MLTVKEFFNLYNNVFDENDSIKAVGREHTKRLIETCEQFSSNTDFGSKATGFMNVANIKMLRNKLQES